MLLEWYLVIILFQAPFGALQGPLDSYEVCQKLAEDMIVLGQSLGTPTQAFCAVKRLK